jgi:hypothetical protein
MMNPTELFKPDREEFDLKAGVLRAFARREAETFEEMIRTCGTIEGKSILGRIAEIRATRHQTKIDMLEKASRTWLQLDIEEALRVLYPNLPPA